MLIMSNADLALAQSPVTPLEISHLAFLTAVAHQATSIISLKGLDTGSAKDVSGVLRVNRGAEAESSKTVLDEKEFLYFVENDGGVRVFDRGT